MLSVRERRRAKEYAARRARIKVQPDERILEQAKESFVDDPKVVACSTADEVCRYMYLCIINSDLGGERNTLYARYARFLKWTGRDLTKLLD